jgi:hypothetical protein
VNVLNALLKKGAPRGRTAAECDDVSELALGGQRKRGELILRFKKTDLKACATLTRDGKRVVTFFDPPEARWIHFRIPRGLPSSLRHPHALCSQIIEVRSWPFAPCRYAT